MVEMELTIVGDVDRSSEKDVNHPPMIVQYFYHEALFKQKILPL